MYQEEFQVVVKFLLVQTHFPTSKDVVGLFCFVLSKLCAHCGAWTHDPEIKSRLLYHLGLLAIPKANQLLNCKSLHLKNIGLKNVQVEQNLKTKLEKTTATLSIFGIKRNY